MQKKWKYSQILSVGAMTAAVVALSGCPEEPAAYESEGPSGDFAAPPPGAPPQGEPPAGAPAPGGEAAAPGNEAAAPAPDGVALAGEGDAAPPNPPPSEARGAAPNDPPGGGGGMLQLESLPKEVLSQDALKSSGKGVKIKGTISGSECDGKKIRLDALQKGSGNPPIKLVTAKIKTGIGAFEMLVPKGDNPVWILASCDVNGDGSILPSLDLTAAYADNPVTPTEAINGVSLKLTKDKITEGLPNQGPAGDGVVPEDGNKPEIPEQQ